MPRTRLTTTILVAVLITGAALYGVTAQTPSAVPPGEPEPASYNHPDSEPEPASYDYPDHPAQLLESDAVSFAIDYEEAAVYERITEQNGGEVSDFDLGCDGYLAEIQNEDESLVTLECAYTYHTEIDGKVAIVDGVPYSVTYRITAEAVERSEMHDDGDTRSKDTPVSSA